MQKFVPLNQGEVPVVNHITPDNIIGFTFGCNSKGFVRTSNYATCVTEDTIVTLNAVEGIERSNGWIMSGVNQSWKDAIKFLIKKSTNIFVFNDSKELVKWLAEE